MVELKDESSRTLLDIISGYDDLSSMDPDNNAEGSFGNWLRLSLQELMRAGHQATADDDQMNVYVVDLQPKS